MKLLIFCCIISFSLFACNESSKTATGSPEKDSVTAVPASNSQIQLTSYRWKLKELAGKAIDSINGQEPFITFNPEDSSVAGTAGCNRFGGKYAADGNSIRFSKFFSTKMACANMWAENTFLGKIDSINRFRINNRELHLLIDSADQAIFEGQPLQ